MTMEDLFEYIDGRTDEEAVDALHNAPYPDLDFALLVLVQHLRGRQRRKMRSMIKTTIINFPEPHGDAFRFVPPVGRRERDLSLRWARTVFTEWMIGRRMLGTFTKEELIAEAEREEKAGYGHLFNAQFYRILAEPMEPGQLVPDYWEEHAVRLIQERLWRGAAPRPRRGGEAAAATV